jgi:hypothetical protein
VSTFVCPAPSSRTRSSPRVMRGCYSSKARLIELQSVSTMLATNVDASAAKQQDERKTSTELTNALSQPGRLCGGCGTVDPSRSDTVSICVFSSSRLSTEQSFRRDNERDWTFRKTTKYLPCVPTSEVGSPYRGRAYRSMQRHESIVIMLRRLAVPTTMPSQS